ncbi:MAG: efflux transporter outer membrane subunit [Candidatus Handelsmanbacteria bacterium]|nr:efflux transporter outer membrane subunit [Candidatus Handelsmanbacteria bacterium]
MRSRFGVLTLLLAGCAAAPGVRPPEIAPPPATWTAPAASGMVDTLGWAGLGDSLATGLVAEALRHNHNLQAAAARLGAALAQARAAGAPLWPQAGGDLSGSRARRNFIGLPIPSAGDRVLASTSNTYGASLNLNWEVDLWGRLRAGAAAARADAEAARAELRGAQLSLAAQTLRVYFAAVEARRQVELAQTAADNYHLSSQQVRAQYERGLRSSLDLRLALSSQAGAEANLAGRQRLYRTALRQLEVLAGRYPAALIQTSGDLPPLPPPVPAGLPAELVGRRPDLAAARERLLAADARLASARAALYPRLSLTASGGRSSGELGDLLDGEFAVWNLVGNLSQPLFQGGRLRAGVDLASAGREGAVAAYAQTLLQAYAEVESALDAETYLQTQEQALCSAADEALAARRLAEERYARGLTDMVTLLTAQNSAFESESRWLATRRQQLEARLDLHLALGGGFSPVPDRAASSDPE